MGAVLKSSGRDAVFGELLTAQGGLPSGGIWFSENGKLHVRGASALAKPAPRLR